MLKLRNKKKKKKSKPNDFGNISRIEEICKYFADVGNDDLQQNNFDVEVFCKNQPEDNNCEELDSLITPKEVLHFISKI